MVATRRHPTGDFPDPATTTSIPTTTSSSPSSKKSSASTLTTKQPRSPPPNSYTHTPPSLLTLWLLISLPLVIWDTLYVFLRPHTMAGGSFHSPIWTPYALYATIDHVYGWPAWNAGSGFTAAQSSLNVVETVIYAWYLSVVWRKGKRGKGKEDLVAKVKWFVGLAEQGEGERGRKMVQGPGVAAAVAMAFAAAVMTVSKTMLYGLHEYHSGFAHVGHNDFLTLIVLWVIPNGAWLVFPSYMIYMLGREIVEAMQIADGKKAMQITDGKKAKR